MNVPILDDAYMQRRNERLLWAARMAAMTRSWSVFDRPDTAESLREAYATGKLTFEQFEERLERVL